MGNRRRHILLGAAALLVGANALPYPRLLALPGEQADPRGDSDHVVSRGVPFSFQVKRDTGPFVVREFKTDALTLDLGFALVVLLGVRTISGRLVRDTV